MYFCKAFNMKIYWRFCNRLSSFKLNLVSTLTYRAVHQVIVLVSLHLLSLNISKVLLNTPRFLQVFTYLHLSLSISLDFERASLKLQHDADKDWLSYLELHGRLRNIEVWGIDLLQESAFLRTFLKNEQDYSLSSIRIH